MKFLFHIGRYFLMIKYTFTKFTNWNVLKKLILQEIDDLILGSIGIVAFMSFLIGGVVAIQTALAIENPLLPGNLIGFATRQSVILEFAPTLISIIMAGKVGSFITSSIGTMRVTEQIDALEVMGINSFNYLIFPKIISLLLYPFLITLAMFLGILGGYIASVYAGFSTSFDFIQGIQLDFQVFHIVYTYSKTMLFAFVLATIPSYHGFYMKGGALEVGKASNISFVWTSSVIIILNFIVTQLLLA